MKPIHLLILALFLALAIAGCTRSIAPPPEQPPTVEAPAEGPSSIQIITPETERDSPVTPEAITGTLEAPGGISVLCAYPPDWVPYIVQEGDTLEAMSLYFGIDAGDISVANCLYAAGIPEVGETVYLPPAPTTNGTGQAAGTESQASGSESQSSGGESSTAAEGSAEEVNGKAEETSDQASKKSSCKSPYKVRSGEWVYKIGRKCNISPYAIIAYNHLSWPYWLRPGQVLLFPKNAPPFPGN